MTLRRGAGIAAALALLAAGCQLALVRGSGDLVEQRRELGDFARIAASHAFEVDVRIGDDPSVTVVADDNLIEHVTMGVSGGLLTLGLRPGFQVRGATLQATVVAPRVDELRASGAAVVRVQDTVDGDRLRVHASGASDVAAPLAVTTLEVLASGASTIRLEGRADEAVLEASGASELELRDLDSASTRAQLSGASGAVVGVEDTLEADLSGASSLTYHGDPTVRRQSVTGASSLEQAG